MDGQADSLLDGGAQWQASLTAAWLEGEPQLWVHSLLFRNCMTWGKSLSLLGSPYSLYEKRALVAPSSQNH